MRRFHHVKNIIILILFLGTSLHNCSTTTNDLNASDIKSTFEKGMDYFEKENWLKAEEIFTFIIYNDPGGNYADDAQFYLAETFFNREDYQVAISEYDRLIRRMKNSPFVEDALWRKTESYYKLSPDYRLERSMTDKALKYLMEFIDIYPQSVHREQADAYILEIRNKLAMKYLDTGKLYDTLGEYESAIYYYESIIAEYPDTKIYSSAILLKAGDLVALERWDEARKLLTDLAENGRDDLSPKELIHLKTLGKKVIEKTSTTKE